MEKIRFIADSASDIPDEDLREYGIDMTCVPIVVDGKEYVERKSFSIREFYEVLINSHEIPVTSRVPVEDFLAAYRRAFADGCTHAICVTINAGASGTNASAHQALEAFFREAPEAKDKMAVHIVDSRTYSAAYGYPVVQGARMAREGKPAAEILRWLDDWFSRVEIYLGCYSLEYARKSGRIGAATAFVGDVLGLRPVIAMIDGETRTIEKVRGEKNLVGRILSVSKEAAANASDPVLVVCGAEESYGCELQKAIKRDIRAEAPIWFAGASITINAGPRMVAAIVLGKKRPRRKNAPSES